MLHTWLRKRGNPSSSPQARRRSLPLHLEMLEERAVPAILHWTGDGGTLNWDFHRNWDLDRVPIAGDSVVISNTFAGITIAHSQGNADVCDSIDSYANLKVNAGSLTVAHASTFRGDLTVSAVTSSVQGTLSLAANSTVAGQFNLLGGTLAGTANLTVTGVVNWTGGTMQDGGHT